MKDFNERLKSASTVIFIREIFFLKYSVLSYIYVIVSNERFDRKEKIEFSQGKKNEFAAS